MTKNSLTQPIFPSGHIQPEPPVSDAYPMFAGDLHAGHIGIIGTGNPIPNKVDPYTTSPDWFIGTVVTPNGLVWHLFEVRSR
jgi:hypothetical protein